MLAVTIDTIPEGDSAVRRTLAVMRIERVSLSHSICEYVVDAVEDVDGLVATSATFASCVIEHGSEPGNVWAVTENACRAILAAERDDFPSVSEKS